MSAVDRPHLASPVRRLRERKWSPIDRVLLISGIAMVMGCLFITTYTLALADPTPHRIDGAVIGDPAAHPRTVGAVEAVAQGKLDLQPYPSVPAAMRALHEQRVYAALDLAAGRPTLYIASAAGASVARVLQHISAADPAVRVVDAHPLAPDDPSGLDVFYRMLIGTIVGFLTVLQVMAHAGPLALRHHSVFVLGLGIVGSFLLTLVGGVALHGWSPSIPEEWGILALHLLAAASFASLMALLLRRWAVLPTWMFFVILGNTSSGGAVSAPLLPQPFAFFSQWLPSGATVTALRDAVYFRHFQHLRPIAVLVVWAAALFAAWVLVARRREAAAAAAAR
jgi:hypothetical protein